VKTYRVMLLDANGRPVIGTRFGMLGVRPTDPNNSNPRRRFDVAANDPNDEVVGGEGLSTSLDPNVLKVRNGEGMFELETADLPAELRENPDHPPHCLIEPSVPTTLQDFQLALAGTLDLWQRVQ